MKNLITLLIFMTCWVSQVSAQVEVYSGSVTSNNGSCTGVISVQAVGDAGPFSIEIYRNNPQGQDYLMVDETDILDGQSSTSKSYEVLVPELYTVTVTDAFGCTKTEEVRIFCGCDNFQFNNKYHEFIIEHPMACNTPDGSISYYSPTGPIAKNGVAPFTYTWSDGYSSSSFDRGNISEGIISVTIEDANGCILSKSFEFVSESRPSFSIDIKEPCEDLANGDLQFTVIPNSASASTFTYDWQLAGGEITFIDNNGTVISNLPKGQYCVTVTNVETLCQYDFCYDVEEIPSCGDFEIDSESIIIEKSCPFQNTGSAYVNARGGNPNLIIANDPNYCTYDNYDSYAWTRIGETEVLSENAYLTGQPAGSYEIVITDICGRQVSENIVIGEHPEIIIPEPDIERGCPGEGIITFNNVSGGAGGPFTMQWSNGQMGSQAANLISGSYRVTVTDGAGCFQTKDVAIENYMNPEISFVNKIEPCFDLDALGSDGNIAIDNYQNGRATASISWGNSENPGIDSYEWTLNGQVISTTAVLDFIGSDLNFSSDVSIGKTFMLSVIDGNGCSSDKEITFFNSVQYQKRQALTGCECEIMVLCAGEEVNTFNDPIPSQGWKNCGLDSFDCRQVVCNCEYPSVFNDPGIPIIEATAELDCPDIEEFKEFTVVTKPNCLTENHCPTFGVFDVPGVSGHINGSPFPTPGCHLNFLNMTPSTFDIDNPPNGNTTTFNFIVPDLGGDVTIKINEEKDLEDDLDNPILQETFAVQDGFQTIDINFAPSCIGNHIISIFFGSRLVTQLIWVVNKNTTCESDLVDEDAVNGNSSEECNASLGDFESFNDCESWSITEVSPNPFITNGEQTLKLFSTSTGQAEITLESEDDTFGPNTFDVELGDVEYENPGNIYNNNISSGVYTMKITYNNETQTKTPIIVLAGRPGSPVSNPYQKELEELQSSNSNTTTVMDGRSSEVEIYPNPFESKMYIQFASDSNMSFLQYELISLQGKLIQTKYFDNLDPSVIIEMDLSSLTPNTYVLSIKTETSSVIKKVVKL